MSDQTSVRLRARGHKPEVGQNGASGMSRRYRGALTRRMLSEAVVGQSSSRGALGLMKHYPRNCSHVAAPCPRTREDRLAVASRRASPPCSSIQFPHACRVTVPERTMCRFCRALGWGDEASEESSLRPSSRADLPDVIPSTFFPAGRPIIVEMSALAETSPEAVVCSAKACHASSVK